VLGPTTSTNGVVSITDNIFDSPTTNSINNSETTFSGLPSTWNCYANKNQTGYIAIPKFPYLVSSYNVYPPTDKKREYVKYVDSGNFSAGGAPAGLKEGLFMNYYYAFVEFGNFAQGLGPFSVQNGINNVTCNISVTGNVSDLVGMRIRFNEDDVFYVITSVTPSSGTSLTSFTISSATSSSFYQGLQNTNATGRIYNIVPSSGKLLTNVGAISSPIATYNFMIDMNELLPTNVQILTFVVGVNALSGSSNITGGFYQSIAYQSTSSAFNTSSLAGSMADVQNYTGENASASPGAFISIGTSPGQVTPAALGASTQYLINDISANPFITGKGSVIRYSYSFQIIMSVADQNGVSFPSSSVETIESPVIVKYRW
jgi:hypothetical protein